jgi:pimeloyl-ACP methyl ester carboxylesterase
MTFALVHGAFHGAWCFELLEEELHQRGESTVSMDMPIDDPDLGAADYATVVTDSLKDVDDEIILLGHSMGGLVIPLVAALRPVRQLIYLSGAIRPPGQTTAVKLAGQPITSAVDERGCLIADHDSAIEQFYPDVESTLAEWAVSMLRPQSPKPIREVGPDTPWPELPVAAIVGTEDIWLLDHYQQTCRDLLDIEAILIPGGHSPFLAQPGELADLLIKIAKS